jgi:hypothetical protein
MAELMLNNQGASSESQEPKNLSLAERADQYLEKQNAWRNLSGGCPISADVEATLTNLSASVRPIQPDLAAMIRAAVLQYGNGSQTFEQIWSDKIAEGANYIGVVEGVFGFYKGDQKLETANKPLRISALPPLLEFREKEKELVRDQARSARAQLMADLRKLNAGATSSGDTGSGSGGLQTGNNIDQSIS